MKSIRKHLEKLREVKKKHYHPLIHKIHKKHKISKRTLFYVKEYGPHTNVPKTIIKESIKILLFASIISSLGGFALEQVKAIFIAIVPLLVLMPVLNGMIGNYGIVVSSKFSTMLHENKVKKKWWEIRELKKLALQIFLISLLTTVLSTSIALLASPFLGYSLTKITISKIFLISILDVVLLVSILFLVAIFAGIYFYKKGEDPSNFLIPITTSIADFGNMLLLSLLVILFF